MTYDLWTEATYDSDREEREARLISAREAVADLWPFLSSAVSESDYSNRKALVESRLNAASEHDPELRQALVAAFDADFAVIDEPRKKERETRARVEAENKRRASLKTAEKWRVEFIVADGSPQVWYTNAMRYDTEEEAAAAAQAKANAWMLVADWRVVTDDTPERQPLSETGPGKWGSLKNRPGSRRSARQTPFGGKTAAKVEVYLNETKDPDGRPLGMMRGYEAGDSMKLASSYEEDGDPIALREKAWERFNIGTDEIAQEYRAGRNRSLSVGDVVVVDGTAWSVDMMGWTELGSFTGAKTAAIKYEIYDKENPDLKGQRFSTREAAEKELEKAVPPERWAIREVGRESAKTAANVVGDACPARDVEPGAPHTPGFGKDATPPFKCVFCGNTIQAASTEAARKTGAWAAYTIVDESKFSPEFHKRFIGYFESEAEAKAFAESEYGVPSDVWGDRVYLTSTPGNPEVTVVDGREVPFTGSLKTANPEFEAILSRASAAGFAALNAAVPTPMTVYTPKSLFDDTPAPGGQSWYVSEGASGFAWVNMPATTGFARYVKATRFDAPRSQKEAEGGSWDKDSYYGGYTFWIWAGGQSMDRKEAFARAYSDVLNAAGIAAHSHSRMD